MSGLQGLAMENFCVNEELKARERKPEHISFSSFKIYNQCPHKFYLMKVVNALPYQANEHTIIGTGVHSVLEHVFKLKNEMASIKSSEFLDVYKESAKSEIVRLESRGESLEDKQIERIFSVDAAFLKSIVSNVLFDVGEAAEDFVIEEQINYPLDFLYDGTKMTFELRLDLHYSLYEKRVIRDWKTASKLWGEDKKSDFWGVTAQLCLYKFFLHKSKGIPPENIEPIYSIFKKTKAYRVEHWKPTYNRGQVRELLEKIKEMVGACERMEFPRSYNCVDYAGYQGDIMCAAYGKKELCDAGKKYSKTL